MVGEKLFQTNLLSRLSHKVCRLLSSPVLLSKFTTIICMDPHSPNKLFPTKYCFLILGDEFLFLNHFFIFRLFFFFVILCYFVIIVLLLFFRVPECSGMFRNGPCSGMFHVPDFIDARKELFSASSVYLLLFITKREEKLQR